MPIRKSGPVDELSNYRPISLLVSLSKVFERLIYNQLISFFQCNKIITPTQFGLETNTPPFKLFWI